MPEFVELKKTCCQIVQIFFLWIIRCGGIAADDDDDNDEGRINFSVALSPRTIKTRNNKLKQ